MRMNGSSPRLALAGLLAGLVVALAACGRESTTGVTNAAGAGDNLADFGASRVAPMAPPTIEELTSRLHLSPNQVTVVTAALQRWQDAVAERQSFMREHRRGPGMGPFRGRGRGGFGGHGPGHMGGGMGQGRGMGQGGGMGQGQAGPGFMGRGEAPVIGFLGDVSGTLDSDQFVSLVQFLDARRPAPPDSLDQRPFGAPPALRRFAKDNDLTAAQIQALRAAFQTAARSLGDLRKGIVEGTITGDAVRSQAAAIRDQLAQSAHSALGDQTYPKFVATLADMRTRFADMMLQHAGQNIDRRVEMLAKLLVLTDPQKSQVQSALQAAVPDLRTLLNGIKDGSVPFEDAVFRAWQIASNTDTALRALLNADQLARYNALRTMIGDRPFFRIYL